MANLIVSPVSRSFSQVNWTVWEGTKQLSWRNALAGEHIAMDPHLVCSTCRIAHGTVSRVTGGPSKMTNYVVVGENAGAKKLETIHNLKIQTLNEDEFLELIRTRDPGEVDEKTKKAREKQEKDIEKQVQELEKREKEEESLRRRKEAALAGTGLAAK